MASPVSIQARDLAHGAFFSESGRASHSFTVLSAPADASHFPSGLNATLKIPL